MRVPMMAAALVSLVAAAPAWSDGAPTAGAFEVVTPAPGVHVFRNATAGFPGTNSIVVERRDGLLVVDAQPSPEAAKALLAAIALISKAPVRYLVYTHPHTDAVGGASAFPKDVIVVAATRAHDALADASYDAGAEVRARAPDPAAWVEPARVLPVLHADAPVVLDDPDRKVVLYPIPHAHSRGDAWVDVPSAGVIAVGDTVVTDHNPYGGDANVQSWINAVNDLVRGRSQTIVPLSGPIVGALEVRQFRDGLAWVRQKVEMAFTNPSSRDTIVPSILADPKLTTWFDLAAKPSFAKTVADAAFAEALEDRRRRGLP